LLRHVAEQEPRLGALLGGVASRNPDLARVGTEHADEQPQERGLPGTIGPDDPVELVLAHVEVDAVDRSDASEAFRQSVRGDGGAHPSNRASAGMPGWIP